MRKARNQKPPVSFQSAVSRNMAWLKAKYAGDTEGQRILWKLLNGWRKHPMDVGSAPYFAYMIREGEPKTKQALADLHDCMLIRSCGPEGAGLHSSLREEQVDLQIEEFLNSQYFESLQASGHTGP